MTSKDCQHHSGSSGSYKIIRLSICAIISSSILLIVLLVLAKVIIHPSKPRFFLQDATVISFNVSRNRPRFLTSSFQVTLSSRNPDGKTGIYYDRLHVCVSHQDQRITDVTSIPATYQGHKKVNVWPLLVGGNFFPVAPDNAASLDQEQTSGAIKLRVDIDGRVRWKALGFFTTRTYHLHVRCPAYIHSGNSSAGVSVGNNAVKYTLYTTCSVVV